MNSRMTLPIFQSELFRINSIAVGMIVLLFLILYFDFNAKRKASGEVVGTVTYKVKEVNRKSTITSIWDEMEVNTEIYNYDTIRTDNYSKAVIKLENNTEIQLEENSMIVFNLSPQDVSIDFMQGNILLDTQNTTGDKKDIKVKSGESEVKLDNSAVTLNKSSSSNLDVVVSQGNAEVKTGETIEKLSVNDELKVRGEKTDKKKRTIKLLNPVRSKYFLSERKEQTINFEWDNGGDKGKKVKIEILSISNKPTPIVNQEITGENYKVNFKPGKYSWKVTDENEETTSYENFYIVDENPVELFTPENNAIFKYSITLPRILISWNKNEFINQYTIEISKTRNFDKKDYKLTTENETTVVDFLEEGTYYYRVLSKTGFPESVQKTSQTNSFTITKAAGSVKPEILSPSNFAEFVTDSKIGFVWKDSTDYAKYELNIATDPDFKDVVWKETSSAKSITVTESLLEGQYYYKLKGFIKDKNQSVDSDTRVFIIKKELEKNITLSEPSNNSEMDQNSVQVSWEKSDGVSKYILEISNNLEFTDGVTAHSLTNNRYRIDNLKQGRYYWRVKGFNKTNKLISRSDPFSFSIIIIPTPTVLIPKNNSSIDLVDKDSIEFKWENMQDAVYYTIEVNQISNDKNILRERFIKKNEFILDDLSLLKTGEYELKLSARLNRENVEEYNSKQRVVRFKVFVSKKTSKDKIKFITPEEIYIEE